MILIDYRKGSGELQKYFQPFGITPKLTKLEFGDFAFEGHGPKGRVSIGIERKRVEDLLDSIMSKRLSGHQLGGMCEHYDYGYLFVEGNYWPGRDGEIVVSSRGGGTSRQFPYRAVDNYLTTLELRAGLMMRRTGRPEETVYCIVDLYRYWTEKLWSEHNAHQSIYAPGATSVITTRKLHMTRHNYTLPQKTAINIACQLPGIDARARDIAQFFEYSSRRMVNAPASKWRSAGLGKVLTAKIDEALG